MIPFDKDLLFESKNIYACLVKQKDLKDKNFQLRTPKIEIVNKEGLIQLIKNKYGNINTGFTFLVEQLEKYLKIDYTKIPKAKYRYLQNFKKNKINLVFLRVISLALTNNFKESIELFNKFSIQNNYIQIKNLKLKLSNPNKRISYLIGVISGDGHLDKNETALSIYDGQSDKNKLKLSKQYLDFINNLIKKEFDLKGRIYRKKENCWVCGVYNKWLCRFINHYFEIPFGNKCSIIKFTKSLSNQEKYFWRGLMDTDGYIKDKAKQIVLKSKSLILVNQFKDFCKRNKIDTDIRREERAWSIRILANSFLNYANLIGLSHPRKKNVLLLHLKKGPNYKILKTSKLNNPLLKYLKPYKDVVYISFSEHNNKTNKQEVKSIIENISKSFKVKITEIKRNRYNNNYCICSKSFVDYVKNNTTFELPWQPLNKSEINNLSKEWIL